MIGGIGRIVIPARAGALRGLAALTLTVMFGSHLSIAGNMSNALREAESLGLDCVQVFTKNQQQWKAPPLKDEVVDEWKRELARLGWATGDRAVSHASYLINLASPNDDLWRASIDLMTEEIERCQRLGIPFLVHHPGAFTTSTLDEGLGRIASAYEELFRRTPGYGVVSCLENTAGGGSTIGREFADLARLRGLIIEKTGAEARVGFCFDTCHAHAAGYDMAGREKAAAVLDEFDRICGLPHLRVLHLNDSKGACGSRLDRHEHIGQGQIGPEGFAAVLNRSELAGRPMILETPKGADDDGTPLDTVNIRRLRALMGVPPAETDQSPRPKTPNTKAAKPKAAKPKTTTSDAPARTRRASPA